MRTFGERLQREREMRGITLEEIAEATKIGTRSLRALELEEYDKLPGGIFNKGFVRAYARFLGIDEEQAVADYLASNRESEAALAAQQAIEQEELPEEPSPAVGALGRIAVFIILLTAVAAGGWYLYNRRNMLRENQSAIGAVPDQTARSPLQAAPTPQVASAPEKPGAAAPKPSPQPATTSTKPAAVPPPPAAAGKTTPSSAAVSPAKPAPTNVPKLVVRIRAHSDAWMQVTADGKLVLEAILKASDERVVRAEKQVVMDIGNAGGVEISYNGKPVPPLGPEGKRRIVTFTPDGIQQ